MWNTASKTIENLMIKREYEKHVRKLQEIKMGIGIKNKSRYSQKKVVTQRYVHQQNLQQVQKNQKISQLQAESKRMQTIGGRSAIAISLERSRKQHNFKVNLQNKVLSARISRIKSQYSPLIFVRSAIKSESIRENISKNARRLSGQQLMFYRPKQKLNLKLQKQLEFNEHQKILYDKLMTEQFDKPRAKLFINKDGSISRSKLPKF